MHKSRNKKAVKITISGEIGTYKMFIAKVIEEELAKYFANVRIINVDESIKCSVTDVRDTKRDLAENYADNPIAIETQQVPRRG